MIKLKTTFQTLPAALYSQVNSYEINHSELYYFNDSLAQSLQLNTDAPSELIEALFQQQHAPIAQAYAGHQFGHFTMLGDGRAMLLGEYQAPDQQLLDIHVKGSGRTPFSRGGDGKATLSAMLREVIYSEALAGLNIPTSRSLALLTTGETIQRQTQEAGALLIRASNSHIRVGTFEYAARLEDDDILRQLIDYSIERLYPDIAMTEDRVHSFLLAVINAQAQLVAKWLQVGFIHGVMNTDNVMISGETLDFGPCAFMNHYDPQACFSSIDQNKRYAFQQQVNITKWNLCRFAETLIPFLDKDQDQALQTAKACINEFDNQFNGYWQSILAQKIGFSDSSNTVNKLAEQLLQLMSQHQLDYHNTFYYLAYDHDNSHLASLSSWLKQWEALLKKHELSLLTAKENMSKVNPVVIPRNHLVEQAVTLAVDKQDRTLLDNLLTDLKSPYKHPTNNINYIDVPIGHDDSYKTYCGT